MSKGIKVLWIVIGCMFGVGIILTATGVALGATGGAYLDRDGIHFGTRTAETTEMGDLNTEAFTNIDIELLEADVEVVVSGAYGYHLTYTGLNEPLVEVRGGQLRIIEDTDVFDNWGISFFRIWDAFEHDAKLTVYVPEDAVLNEVSLSVVSGDTVLDASDIIVNDFEFYSATGNVRLTNLEANEISIEVASGDVTLEDITIASASIDMASGLLTCVNAVIGVLDLDLASGNINYQGEIATALELQMVSGDADFELTGNANDYAYNIEKISGEVLINGQHVSGSFLPSQSEGGGHRVHLEIELTSGSINFVFTD